MYCIKILKYSKQYDKGQKQKDKFNKNDIYKSMQYVGNI